jgi:hypothetical protein
MKHSDQKIKARCNATSLEEEMNVEGEARKQVALEIE